MSEASPVWPPILLVSFVYYVVLGGWLDTVLLLAFSLWRKKDFILPSIDEESLKAASLAVPGIVVGYIIFHTVRVALTTLDGPRWDGPGKPLLIPCKTSHRRMFPEKHAFTYSYLTVGIPVSWAGAAGGMVSAEVPKESGILSRFSLRPILRKGWYDVDAADYLERGNGHLGLRGKLDEYLKAQVSRCSEAMAMPLLIYE
jgi:hypothetical protein